MSLSPKRRKARQAGIDVHPAGRNKQRASLTHVAFICDNTQVQAALPHVFIGNEKALPSYVLQRIAPRLHTNVRLWRRKSAWVDGDALKDILRLLDAALQPFQSKFQPLLMWDALKAHIKSDVLQCAGRLGIWVIIVPAKITWLLQPADTHCFAKYKAYLRRAYLDSSTKAADGSVDLDGILLAMNAAIREVFQATKWANAFRGNGFGSQQRYVRARILEHLAWHATPVIGCTLPNLQQLAHVWPLRLDVPIDALFGAFLPRVHAPARQETHTATHAESAEDMSWASRLRPRRTRESLSQDSLTLPPEPDAPPSPVSVAPVRRCPVVPRTPAMATPGHPLRARALPRCRR